jgi:small subunit ribosomal protein S17
MTTNIESKVSGKSKFKGTVVSVSGKQTISVAVDTYKTHPKYLKKYRSTKKYLVHVPEGEAKYAAGDKVAFVECRPVSKRKQHVIVSE